MKKNQVYLIVIIIIAATAAWFGYQYFSKKNNPGLSNQKKSIQSLSSNSCWVYHEYVYRVDFSNDTLKPFLFIRNDDGTFVPSEAEKPGNQIIGNGFIIDSAGACAITENTATPWILTDDEQKPLKDLVDAWLDLKTGITNREYHITGQTVALFVVLNNPKDFIEYGVSAPVPGQQGYSLIYPAQKIQLSGINPDFNFSATAISTDTSVFQILKTTFDENNTQNPLIKTAIDSISVTKSVDGILLNIKPITGDAFFYEGSAAFDEYGGLLGNLHYDKKNWVLISIGSFIQNPPAYAGNEIQEKWEYDLPVHAWVKNYPKNKMAKADNNNAEETYKPGPLEPTIKVYPAPTPK
ncbi:MAG: hypothetical protein ABI685_08700 [Ferruginibacter sp.]